MLRSSTGSRMRRARAPMSPSRAKETWAPANVIEVLHRPEHGVTIGTVERAFHGRDELLHLLVDLADLSEDWRRRARRALARRE